MTPTGWTWGPDTPELSANEAHVWRVQSDSLGTAALEALLSEDERSAALRFMLADRRQQFVRARACTRLLLARYAGVAPALLQFGSGPFGKPELLAPPSLRAIGFNLSHTRDQLLLAVALDRRVGVDLEPVRRIARAQTIADRFFTTAERAELRAAPASRRNEVFVRLWCRKEAVFKAAGCGVWAAGRALGRRLAATGADGPEPGRFQVQELPLGSKLVGAIAFDRPVESLRLWRLHPAGVHR